jgi:hypothetical protein
LFNAAKPVYPVSGAAACANERFAQTGSGGWKELLNRMQTYMYIYIYI